MILRRAPRAKRSAVKRTMVGVLGSAGASRVKKTVDHSCSDEEEGLLPGHHEQAEQIGRHKSFG
jgi:hypothetical protein